MRKTKKVVFCGIFAALAVLFIYGAGILPTGRMALFCVASCLTAITCVECGWKYALAGYGAASAVALIAVPDKLLVLPYILFLGYYPVVKLWIERLRHMAKEWIIKIVLFLVASAASAAGMQFLMRDAILPFAPLLMTAAGTALLAVFDFALSLFIQFYRERISKMIRNGDKK